jgi:hypothetical protein
LRFEKEYELQMTTTTIAPDVADPMRRGTSPRTTFWVTFLLMFLAIGSWSVVNPAMASPDEPAHAVKAAATVRGQFFGDESHYNAGRGTFEVPSAIAQAWDLTCFAFKPDTPANCARGIHGDLNKIVASPSHVERYNPIYYAVIGLPSLLPLSVHTLTLMRLMSALISAFLIALTARTVIELRRPAWPLAGVIAATTPMTIYIASAMTPQGPEIFGALLTLVLLLALTREPNAELVSRRMWRLVVGAGIFVTARGLSPVFLIFIVALVIFVAPRFSVIWELVKNRKVWPQLGICVGVSIGAVVYIFVSGSLALGIVLPDPTLTAGSVVRTMVLNTDYYLEQLLGVFGWGDTHLPLWTLVTIGSVVAIVLVVGAAFATWRERVALPAVLVIALVAPIAIQLLSYKTSGIVWQGKYILPVAIAMPVIAGFFAERSPMRRDIGAKIVPIVAALAALAQVVGLIVNAHRYINGANGPWFKFIDGAWLPPVNVFLMFGVELAAWIAVVVFVHRVMRHHTGEGTGVEANCEPRGAESTEMLSSGADGMLALPRPK